MARIPYPDPQTLSPDTQTLLSKLAPLNIFRMLAGGEELLRAFVRFGNHLLNKSSLDPVVRELAIMRVGVLSGASYEVHQHEAMSRQLGMSEELIAAVRSGADDPAFDELQRKVLRFTDDIVANVRASDETFGALGVGVVAATAPRADDHDRLLHDGVALPRDVRNRDRGSRVTVIPAESRGEAPGRGRLLGRRILVVGAGQGHHGIEDPPIGNGRATSLLCAREGARVVAADRDGDSAAETVRSITDLGGEASALVADVADPAGVDAMVTDAAAALDGLDGVVYNVGIGAGLGLADSTPEVWDTVLAVNLRGAMLTARAGCRSSRRGRRSCSSPRSPGSSQAAASRRTTRPRRRSAG